MSQTIHTDEAFAFVHDGRTFTCSVEGERASARGRWWWFRVSTESHQRHAPFPYADGDAPAEVQNRICAFYDNMIARRNEPYQSRWQGRGKPRPAASAEAAPPA